MAKGHLASTGKKQAAAGVKGDLWWSARDDGVDDVPKSFTPGEEDIVPARIHAQDTIQRCNKGKGNEWSGVVQTRSLPHSIRVWLRFWLGMWVSILPDEEEGYSEGSPALPLTTTGSGLKDMPRIRTIQTWMKEAWDAGMRFKNLDGPSKFKYSPVHLMIIGYDPQGLKDFKGSIVGTKKWIGTAGQKSFQSHSSEESLTVIFPSIDLYALAVSRGIASLSKIIDGNYMYTTIDASFAGELDRVDLGPIMRISIGGTNDTSKNTGQGSAIVSAKLPLILQHSGHSRTVVGYEIDDAGETSLIVFDPATSIPRGLRKTALEHLRDNAEAAVEGFVTPGGAIVGKRRKLNQQSLRDMMPKSRKEGQSTDPIPVLESDEEMDQAGWVRKKTSASGSTEKSASKRKMSDRMHLLRNSFDLASNPKATLSHFRVSLSALSKHDEYQILSFDGGALLLIEERLQRKIVTATTIFPA
ncbi:hypothetical protein QFC21_004911 [Naganishia friedmannii]|uniref:Uncharacterized protein n=1 Tax=Naganishia friedmannii TaxID=89922 RepID=A0ACC2VE91_9TREE|nr:hypothetical protein QFC21_004911 [Naganishia friedmannii]